MKNLKNIAMIVMALVVVVSYANAGTDVSSDITGSTHWTKAGAPYHLKTQIYVQPGATLTIDAGVVVASFIADQGSLAVCRGAKIYVNGTKEEPVIMTSAEDVATWTGSVVSGSPVTSITTVGDPKTGTWREACNEWGNLTLMGNGMISASHYAGAQVGSNSYCPDGSNEKQMEGLTGGSETFYGGSDDDDDSGSISYLSIRYGGKVVGFANELNGLSLGGIGRGTDIHHVEIMNNVDDGIEIWGGTVNLKYINIWNIGDDSLDVDQGWRGNVQHGLIVQGYSIDASQGSGVGDNCVETDGAEDSYAQPMTTAKIANMTIVGQPVHGDGGTTWRDNARIQYDNCVWVEVGEKLVRPDGDDGDGALGYGAEGTLSWEDHWTTSYNAWKASAFADPKGCGINFAGLYEAYVGTDLDAPLCQITDSVFYDAADLAEATNRGVLDAANNNVVVGWNESYDPLPIQSLVRGAAVTKGGKTMLPVTSINPCAAHDAVVAVTPITEDDIFAATAYRGGFSPYNNWLAGWTSVDAYGMTDTSMNTEGNGDVNNDGVVNLGDLAVIGSNWLEVK
ncbi:MAG: hypothetical protein K9M75_03305 [Phycisphaerae bacterium]|nr:hypothetical protein [Phycisphaerae bacterium]